MRTRKTPRGARWRQHTPNPSIQKPLAHWFKVLPANRYRVQAMNEVMALRILEQLGLRRLKPRTKGSG